MDDDTQEVYRLRVLYVLLYNISSSTSIFKWICLFAQVLVDSGEKLIFGIFDILAKTSKMPKMNHLGLQLKFHSALFSILSRRFVLLFCSPLIDGTKERIVEESRGKSVHRFRQGEKSTAYGGPVQRNSQGHTSLSTSNKNATHTADPAIENGPAAVNYREKNQTSYERRHNTYLRGT
ncbi:hypothetical protein B0H14DRAFT_3142840 [Mycena olivaceomarginata]|nr:hypothetical protein B0H14DRAFT_3142840 [Mycena olivaceomarginata]